MYKTCFECPHIREYHAGMPGRTSWYCPKLTKILGKHFIIDKMGHRPKICPLLKRNKLSISFRNLKCPKGFAEKVIE